MRLMTYTLVSLFQSTLSHGERQHTVDLTSVDMQFQSTLSHGERLKLALLLNMALTFQSTLSHGERLRAAVVLVAVTKISIHSLAWRETT